MPAPRGWLWRFLWQLGAGCLRFLANDSHGVSDQVDVSQVQALSILSNPSASPVGIPAWVKSYGILFFQRDMSYPIRYTIYSWTAPDLSRDERVSLGKEIVRVGRKKFVIALKARALRTRRSGDANSKFSLLDVIQDAERMPAPGTPAVISTEQKVWSIIALLLIIVGMSLFARANRTLFIGRFVVPVLVLSPVVFGSFLRASTKIDRWAQELADEYIECARTSQTSTDTSVPSPDPVPIQPMGGAPLAPDARSYGDNLWAFALAEYESTSRRAGLYARLFAEHDGNEAKVKSHYLKARVGELSNATPHPRANPTRAKKWVVIGDMLKNRETNQEFRIVEKPYHGQGEVHVDGNGYMFHRTSEFQFVKSDDVEYLRGR